MQDSVIATGLPPGTDGLQKVQPGTETEFSDAKFLLFHPAMRKIVSCKEHMPNLFPPVIDRIIGIVKQPGNRRSVFAPVDFVHKGTAAELLTARLL